MDHCHLTGQYRGISHSIGFFIDPVTVNQLYEHELSQINFVSIILVNDRLDKDINKNIQLMSTSDFVKGLIISYMDQGLSSRQTSERISGLINKYNPQNRMVDENFEQKFQISYKTCAKIFNRFRNELSYQDLRENNGKEPIQNQEEQENIVQIKNSDDLFNSVCEIFYNFDIIQQTIRNSYNSMKKRIEQVYIQEGDNI
ncbi:hypothetical protein ABPG72_016534 [Tetrahymena utriculariae]